MDVKKLTSINKDEQLKVKAGNAPAPGQETNPTETVITIPGTVEYMVKDSSIT